jgi:hypothetical protein
MGTGGPVLSGYVSATILTGFETAYPLQVIGPSYGTHVCIRFCHTVPLDSNMSVPSKQGGPTWLLLAISA